MSLFPLPFSNQIFPQGKGNPAYSARGQVGLAFGGLRKGSWTVILATRI